MKTPHKFVLALCAAFIFSCQKEENSTPTVNPVTPATQKPTQATTPNNPSSAPQIGGPTRPSYYRLYNPSFEYCVNLSVNCLPDVIVQGLSVCEPLDRAIKLGGKGIATLFRGEEFALSFIPTWNNEEFADAKASILSGDYTFIKKETKTGCFYFLGKESELTLDHYDLVFPVVIR